VALGRVAPDAEDVAAPLVGMLRDSDPVVRLCAIEALEGMVTHGTTVAPALAQALRDPVLENRLAAMRSLGDLGPEAWAALPALRTELQSPVPGVSAVAGAALAAIGDLPPPAARLRRSFYIYAPGPLPLGRVVVLLTETAWLDAGLASEPPAMLVQRLSRLREAGAAAAVVVSVLGRQLGSADAGTRVRAAWLLGLLGPAASPAVEVLRGRLADRDPAVRESVVRALGLIGPGAGAAVAALTPLLEDEDGRIRLAALFALRRIGAGPASLKALWGRLRSPVAAERAAAAHAICLLGVGSGPVDAFTKALDDPDARVRYWAAEALGRRGPAASVAVPSLLRLLQRERSPGVRVRVVTAVLRILSATLPLRSASGGTKSAGAVAGAMPRSITQGTRPRPAGARNGFSTAAPVFLPGGPN
jgi:HEAT repeat protein